jgi:hypothetical protein
MTLTKAFLDEMKCAFGYQFDQCETRNLVDAQTIIVDENPI